MIPIVSNPDLSVNDYRNLNFGTFEPLNFWNILSAFKNVISITLFL